ncbi:PhzF family phenazine biosynthesis protein [Deinococcus yavapaiensis]|uniref:PhzF family phenazine biosynthesis protein n=1 Tax=Deinococcus yavapaiensis KR-236 TaxID=694435 RepID=A0A318S4B7_9DEIO|nr:PhzF family phenazine biosynthesis protein [Deinococcus yavapaiensis]PYE52910.1 PhzF family phenazine biosynthesis protein [Deinococcus yavapaiensis KR-236]
MPSPLFIVDAFTSEPFSGNPAAVVLLDAPRDDAWLQLVAREMNLSETAFVAREGEAWRLRWFTPQAEVKLCGHATLATAYVLWKQGRLPLDEAAEFETLSGRLTATRVGEEIELDFPAEVAEPCEAPSGLLEALGVRSVRFVGWTGVRFFVEVNEASKVRALQPDFAALRATVPGRAIVTARSDDARFDMVSRYFAPGIGVDEDPVTGSAHCALGPYWMEKLGKADLVGYQASERGGQIEVGVRGGRVKLRGRAVTVVRGELQV